MQTGATGLEVIDCLLTLLHHRCEMRDCCTVAGLVLHMSYASDMYWRTPLCSHRGGKVLRPRPDIEILFLSLLGFGFRGHPRMWRYRLLIVASHHRRCTNGLQVGQKNMWTRQLGEKNQGKPPLTLTSLASVRKHMPGDDTIRYYQ